MTHRERHLAEGIFELKARPGEGFCPVKGCRKAGHSQKFSLCHCHYQHRWRMRSPKRSAYATLRDHAKQRGIKFTISFDFFLGLTEAFRFFDHEAESRGETLTIDRKEACKGYEPGNVIIMTHRENVQKGNRERHLPEYVQALLSRKRAKAQGEPCASLHRDEDANPF